MKRKSLLLMMLLALGAPWAAQAQFTGNGTESNPYQISSQNDWHTLATNVYNGDSYSGKFFKLTQNISVTEMVGGNATDNNNEGRPFSGTFDGDGYTLTFTYSTNQECCAPFRSASGATFKNLRVDGSITTSAQYAGGIVGIGRGSTDGITFTNCVSNITITSTYNGDSTHGGFAAILFDGEQHFTGCVFTGSFNGTSSTSWAGFVGYSHTWGSCYGSAYDKCVFAPTSIQASVPSSCAAFDRNSSGCDFTNCYYTTDYGTNDGTKVYSVTGESPVNVAMRGSATNTYELNNSNCSLKFYSAGLTLTKAGTTTVYGASGSTLSLTLNGASAYSANHGTLAGSGSDYTLVMPSSNVVISEGQGGGGGSDGTLTVYDGTATSQTVPMYVYYFDDYTRSQFVIPASNLTDMAGGTINSIKFYTKSDNIPYTTVADFDIYVKEVNYTTITALEAKSSATTVYQGKGNFVTEGSGGSITITFSNPFIYNGGNLLIGCDNTTDAGYKNIYFYGQEVAGASTGASNGSSLDQVGFSQQNFIPKTTFFYTLDGNCEDFENVSGVDAANGAGNMPEGWNYIYTGSNIGYRPKVYNGSSYKPSEPLATVIGNNRLMMIAGTSSDYGENTYVILPPYENVTGISFNAWRESASNGTLYFGYITNANDASTFHQLQQLTTVYYRDANTTNASFEYNNLSIPSGARLAFRWNHNNSWYSAFIDNVCVKVEDVAPTYITEIASVADWNEFCANVNNGHSYSGETVTMTTDVGTVSTMCGTVSSGDIASPANCFSGIFDGQGHTLDVSISNSTDQGTAPFRSIYGATIQNLKVTGSVTSTTHGSGLVGFVKAGTDSSTIENCQVSTNVNSTNSHIGGIVGHAKTSTVVLNGCVYDGLLTSSNWKGGLIGWADAATVQLTDCLFNGTVSTTTNFHPIGCKDGSSTVSGTVANCYYYATNNISDQTADNHDNSIVKSTTGKGKRAYSITGQSPVTVANAGNATTYGGDNVTHYITGYGTGIEYDNVIYGGQDDQLSLNLGNSPTGLYQADHGTLTASGAAWILAMAAYDTEISVLPFTKTIAAYSNSQTEKGGYYLIASPLAAAIAPTAVDGMITDNYGSTATTSNGTYDLYSFNQDQELEWKNYRTSTFNLVNGTGYLYASKNGTILTFSGAPYSGDTKTVTLSKTDDVEFSGWNLVGNPFSVDAYITKPFYTLENSGTYTENTAGTRIQAMQGLLVVAGTDNESLTFSTEATGSKVAKLNMNVSKGNSVVDHAIISFSEGQQLPKLQFRKGSTKVYIPQEGKDYAIVSTESMGTMPVSFKAENNGTYTLSFKAEEVSFAYLHLIDNMTGIETDLLANPSYTFDARTTDYENRFKLVFATGNNANDDAFAFYSNGSFIINNEGEATLQVIDVNGRILKSESINGCANVNVKAAAGVYMLRLVNGNDVKVQKVVVR